MSFSKELSILVAVLLLSERSTLLAILYYFILKLLPVHLYDEIKKVILRTSIFRNYPRMKSWALKLFNPKYIDAQQSSGGLFFCKCGDQQMEAPGVRPEPDDQGKCETAKAIVSLLDKKKIDVQQKEIVNALLASIGTTTRQWPSAFDGKAIKVQALRTTEVKESKELEIWINVDQVV